MKHLKFTLNMVVVLVLLAIALPAYGQGAPDTPENRRIAAERYIAAVPPDEIIGDAIRTIALQIPEGQRKEFARMMRELIRVDWIRRVSLEAMLKRFTAQELDALANFYGSPEGRSIAKKLGAYMADIQPHMEAELTRVISELKARSR